MPGGGLPTSCLWLRTWGAGRQGGGRSWEMTTEALGGCAVCGEVLHEQHFTERRQMRAERCSTCKARSMGGIFLCCPKCTATSCPRCAVEALDGPSPKRPSRRRERSETQRSSLPVPWVLLRGSSVTDDGDVYPLLEEYHLARRSPSRSRCSSLSPGRASVRHRESSLSASPAASSPPHITSPSPRIPTFVSHEDREASPALLPPQPPQTTPLVKLLVEL
eukprot:Sspe_Gene.70750::Locus_41800_Transcript_7_7_Confidence_0.357_Length_1532::g.70750::m.70750